MADLLDYISDPEKRPKSYWFRITYEARQRHHEEDLAKYKTLASLDDDMSDFYAHLVELMEAGLA